MLGNIKYQPFPVTITASGAAVPIEFDTDKQYSRVTGIFISVPDKSAITSTLGRTELGGKELFPDGYEIKMLTADWSVPSDELYYALDEPAKGARLKSSLKDSGLATAYPYTVTVYLRLENK